MPDEGHGEIEAAPTRPFWSGTIAFGLVAVPVDLYAASRRGGVSLRMLSPEGRPLSRRYVCPEEGREVTAEEIVRGYEVEEGRFVLVSDEELEALEPEKSREIDLRLFVDAASIPPAFFERSYVLTPAGQTNKAYRLLAATMERTGRAGIATFVMREREYLVAIIAEGGVLRAQTLRFADELRSPDDIGLPQPGKADAGKVKRFAAAIAALNEEALDLAEMEDRDTARLRSLIDEKLARGENVVEAEDTEPEPVVDLIKVIQERLRAGRAEEPETASAPDRGRARPEKPRRSRERGETKKRPRTADADLERLPRAELEKRARRADIPGRSRMSKDELVSALRDAR